MKMSNSRTTVVLGWMFLIASFLTNYEVNVICASIFFSAYFIIQNKYNGDK